MNRGFIEFIGTRYSPVAIGQLMTPRRFHDGRDSPRGLE
jgi:hypothetical protein